MSPRGPISYLALSFLSLVACAPPVIEGDAISGNNNINNTDPGADGTISSTDEALTGCDGTANRNIPSDHTYYLTSFGGPQDKTSTGTMSCGGKADGTSFYIADRQRFEVGGRCGGARKVRITATDKHGVTRCVYAQAADYGPAKCVEDAARKPIIDASPAIAQALFGLPSAGWSDKLPVIAEPADDNVALGTNCTPNAGQPAPPAPSATTAPKTGTSCFSNTWQINMAIAECVQSVQDKRWYQCTSAGWSLLNASFADGSQAALLSGGDAGPCTLTHAL